MPFRNQFETTCADAFVLATLLCAVAPVNCVTLQGRWFTPSNARARSLAPGWGIACYAGAASVTSSGLRCGRVVSHCAQLPRRAPPWARNMRGPGAGVLNWTCGQASLASRNDVNEGFAALVVSVRVNLRRVRWLVFLPQ